VVEYLVVAAAVIAVIIGIRGAFQGSIQTMANDSMTKVDNSAAQWAGTMPEGM